MGKLIVKCCPALPKRFNCAVKEIVEIFVGFGISVTHAKVNVERHGLAGEILKISEQCECLASSQKRLKV